MNDVEFQNTLIKAIYESSPTGIMVVDERNIIVSHNRKFVDIWHIDRELLQGS